MKTMNKKLPVNLLDYLRDKDEVPSLADKLIETFPDETEAGVALAALLTAAGNIMGQYKMTDNMIDQYMDFFRTSIEISRILKILGIKSIHIKSNSK